MMNTLQIPIARKEGLVIQELPGELLVYDLESNKAHCLNQTAATVWKYCDGRRSIADISRLYTEQSGSRVSEDLIRLAIDQLNENNLLENKPAVGFDNRNRRQVIKKVGLAAVVALPIVTSLVAPKAAHAGSQCNTGTACSCPGGATSCTAAQSTGCMANCTGGCSGNGTNNVCS